MVKSNVRARASDLVVRLKKSSFAKNLFVLAGGTGIAQALGILLSPILSRVYTPLDFGVLGSITALTGVVLAISQLRYESALPLEKDDTRTNELQELCIGILVVVLAITAVLVVFWPEIFFWLDDKQGHTSFLIYGLLIIMATGLYNILFFRMNREEMYKVLATTQVIKRLGVVLIQIVLGLLGLAALGLILGSVLGAVIAILFIIYRARHKLRFPKALFHSAVARTYYRFPLYSAPQALVHTAMVQMPIVVLGLKYGAVVVGAYFFSAKIVTLPATFLGTSVRSVFYKEAVNRKENIKGLFRLFKSTTQSLFLVILIPGILLALAGPEIFMFVFGDDWEMAGKFASWLILWLGTTFVMSPSRALFNVLDKQKLLLWLDVTLAVLRLIVLLVGIAHYDAITVIALYCIVSFIVYFSTIVGWYFFLKRQALASINES